jgi:Cu(I)/Ag(I) efflux system membrane protein CusA/SilA
MAGLLPIPWGNGAGSEVMRRIAVPMVGGMVSSAVLTLAIIPAIYALVKERALRKGPPQPQRIMNPPSTERDWPVT